MMGRRKVETLALALLFFCVSSCSCDSETRQVSPRFAIGGDVKEGVDGSWVVDFGTVVVGGVSTARVSIGNEGTADLWVWLDEEVTEPFGSSLSRDSLSVSPGAVVDAGFRFEPREVGEFARILEISTNEKSGTSHRVHLIGTAVEATLTCENDSLDFGFVVRGSERKLRTSCVNPLPVPMYVALGGAVGKGAQYFFGILPEGERGTTREVGAGESFVVEVTFRAERAGSYAVSLPLFDGESKVIAEIALTAETLDGALLVEPQGCMDFGRVQVGSSRERTFRVTNVSDSDIRLEVQDFTGDSSSFALVSPGGAGEMVVPRDGGSLEIVLAYRPQDPFPHDATLRLKSTDSLQPELSLCMKGESGTAMIACSPASLDFGDVALGSEATLRFLCSNVGEPTPGAAPLFVEAVGADHDRFRVEVRNSDGSSGIRTRGYTVGDSFWLLVSYLPEEEGPAEARVFVDSSAIGKERLELLVKGEGRDLPPCQFAILPPRLRMGLVPLGSQRVASFHIANTFDHACLIHGLRLSDGSDAAFHVDELPSGEIPPGGRLEVPVTFTPSEEGRVEGQVEFFLSNPSVEAPQRVELSGTGGEPCLEIVPERLDFGSVAPGCASREQVVSILNTCAEAIEVEAIRVDEEAYPWFTLASVPLTPLVMEPMRRVEFAVSYEPEDGGEHRGLLELVLAGRESHTIELMGQAGDTTKQTDVFVQRKAKVDVLWVISNGVAMSSYQEVLARHLPKFMDFALEHEIDFHVGVTTTGLVDFSGHCPGGAGGGEAGRLFPLDGSAPRILTSSMEWEALQQAWENNVRVGDCTWTQSFLEPAVLALTPPLVNHASAPGTPLPNDGNLGFLRSDAALSIIVMSHGGFGEGTPAEYVERLRSLKPSTWGRSVKIHAISHGENPDRPDCVSYACPDCVEVTRLSGGHWMDICTPAENVGVWEEGLREMSQSAFGFDDSFRLRGGAADVDGDGSVDDRDVEVRVNGELLASTTESEEAVWRYDYELNAVVFSPEYRPAPGDEISITYEVVCL